MHGIYLIVPQTMQTLHHFVVAHECTSNMHLSKTITHHTVATTQGPLYSALSTLLLATDDFKTGRLLLSNAATCSSSPSLLSDLAPASAPVLALTTIARGKGVQSRSIGDDAAVSELAAANKFFGKATTVDGA